MFLSVHSTDAGPAANRQRGNRARDIVAVNAPKPVSPGAGHGVGMPAWRCACGGTCPGCRMPEVPLVDVVGPADDVPGVEPHALSSGGESISPPVRTFFESKFASDLGNVRLHRDGDADRRSRAFRARAFTVGPDIFFRERAYDPVSDRGLALLAHELTHVVQQGGRRPSSTWPIASREGPLEREAGAVADAIVGGRPLPPIGTGATPAVSCVSDDDLGAMSDWRALSPEERQRILSSGPGYEEIKKEIIASLIEAMTTARQGYVAFLRDQVSANLSPGLQPAASTFIDVIETEMELVSVYLFFELGVVIGFGEGLAGMITGLLRIAWALLEFAVDYILAFFGQLEPLAEDLDALALAWHDLLSIDMMAILEAWRAKFEAAPAEGRAEMVGEFVGEVLAFIATCETSTSRLAKFLPPPPAAAPQLAAAVVGGGSMAVPLARPAARALEKLGPALGLVPPTSLQVMNMSGKDTDDSESGGGATKPPSPTEPATPPSALAEGPIDPALLELLEGVGLTGRSPSEALLQAREALRLGTATIADYEVLLKEAVNDARDYLVTTRILNDKAIESPSWRLMTGGCGPGRDVSVASLAGMASKSAQPLRIERYQAIDVFGPGTANHQFSIVTFLDGTPYLVDPTFAQFQQTFANAADVTFAKDLVRDGFARLDDANGALYASVLRKAGGQTVSASESSALATRLHTGEWAERVETVGAGRPGVMREPAGKDVNIMSLEEILEDAEETRALLLGHGDPYDMAGSMEWLINRIDECNP